MTKFLQTLKNRNFINQATDLDNLDKKLSENKITAYIGFDCTAKSLHIGKTDPNHDVAFATKKWSSSNYFIRWWYN